MNLLFEELNLRLGELRGGVGIVAEFRLQGRREDAVDQLGDPRVASDGDAFGIGFEQLAVPVGFSVLGQNGSE